jgi:hypothetical protein
MKLKPTPEASPSGIACTCPQCKSAFLACTRRVNRAVKALAPLYCGKACASAARRVERTTEEKKARKAAYDRQYRKRDPDAMKARKAAYYQKTRDPEREREVRKVRMPRHVEYCRRPEYKAWKHEYDIQLACKEYGEWAETWRLLLDLEKEIRSQATSYERRVANGYYTRNAQKRRREAWKLRNSTNSTPAT